MTILGMTIYQIFAFFIIYSVIGWFLEVTFHAVVVGVITNRGFLNGPLCPLYGFGMLLLIGTLNMIPTTESEEPSAIIVFLGGLILATFAELIAGWILDRIFHLRWWDYSDKPFNFRGYICLEFSLIWGIGAIIVMKVAHPVVSHLSTDLIPTRIGWIIMVVLYLATFVDLVVTVATINGFNKKLKELDSISKALREPTDALSRTVAENAMKTQGAIEETRLQATLAKAEFRDKAVSIQQMSKQEVFEATKDALQQSTQKTKDALQQSTQKTKDALQHSTQKTKDVLQHSTQMTMSVLSESKDELIEKYESISKSLTESKFFGAGRLMRAFPYMKHRDYKETVQALLDRVSKK